MIRSAVLRILSLTPRGLKQWIYRHPRALGPMAKMVKRLVPADAATVVTFRQGPNRGLKWAVDRSTPNYYWLGEYEGEAERALRPWIAEGMVVADIGAHIGYDTLMFARWVGPGGRVLSFEPDPANFSRLRHNCELNHLANVQCLPLAVSDFNGPLQFLAEGKTTGHLLRGGESATAVAGAMVTVQSVTLDAFVFESSAALPARLNAVKIDVEDHEIAVLAGARRVLNELRPVLLVEIHSPASLEGCRRILRECGYEDKTVAKPSEADGFSIVHLLCHPLASRVVR